MISMKGQIKLLKAKRICVDGDNKDKVPTFHPYNIPCMNMRRQQNSQLLEAFPSD